MIDKKHATKEIMRLQSIDPWLGVQDGDGRVKELVSALQAAEADVIATYVINEWLAREPKMPTPADIRRMVWAENDKRLPNPIEAAKQEAREEERVGRTHCATCQGWGFYGGYLAGPKAGPWKVCRCPAGDADAQVKVDEANIAREKLLKIGQNPRNTILATIDRNKRQLVDEIYKGDF